MPNVTFQTSNKSIEVEQNSNILRTSIRHECSVPFKCGGGICGTCRIQIVQGLENLSAPMKKEVKKLGMEGIEQGYRLACQTFVTGDVTLAWEE